MWRRTIIALTTATVLATLALVLAVLAYLRSPLDSHAYLRLCRSGEMLDREGALLYAYLNPESQWCFERSLDTFGERLLKATLATEDKRFYSHHGVDPLAFVRAAWGNLTGRRIVSGASTITMQVVKRIEQNPRTIPGKLEQVAHAIRLERACSKEQILQTYLNTAPYGLNLAGAEAAARRYFGKPARELTLSEAALLAGLPKAPTRFMPLKNPERAVARRNHVLARMLDEGFISSAEAEAAMAEPVGTQWHDFPQLSPHMAARLKDQALPGNRLTTTLDAEIQETAQRIVRKSLDRYRPEITNAAAILVDVASASVLSWVGSADFYGTPGGGQVDGCRAGRSPGSALKPFTYALAIEQNLLYDTETLLDDSLDYGIYSPENFDEGYNGLISAADALRHSLNIPAVMVMERVGLDPLHDLLQSAGMTTLRKAPAEYGLGLTLGDCEVRLDEMTAAYRMLASLGQYRPLQFLMESPAEPPVPPRRCLAEGTCAKMFEIMEQPLPSEWESNIVRAAGVLPRVCWKTGTSTGHLDAWAFVFNRQYVVGVWMGNNDAKPCNRLVGIRAALPLAGRLFRSLAPINAPDWPDVSNQLRTVRVCAVSGLPASQWCTKTSEAQFPREQFVNRICDVHYPADSSESDKVLERWPGSPRRWNLAHVDVGERAALRAREEKPARESSLRIKEPANRAEYLLTGEAEGDRIALRTSVDKDGPLHWYLDDRYLGVSNPDNTLLMDLSPGKHTLACMNSEGTTDTVTFDVIDPDSTPNFRTN